MTYPEKNAGYTYMPKFIDRMKVAERAEGGMARASHEVPASVDETYAPPPQHGMEPYVEFGPQNDMDRRKAIGQTVVPIETGDKSLISPEDVYAWKDEVAPQGTRRGGRAC